jgi:hypothetical protein
MRDTFCLQGAFESSVLVFEVDDFLIQCKSFSIALIAIDAECWMVCPIVLGRVLRGLCCSSARTMLVSLAVVLVMRQLCAAETV